MTDAIIGLFSFGLLIVSLLGIIALIPFWVTASTAAERNPNHIYNIFWEEAGIRGSKIVAASGALFPFVIVSKPAVNTEGLALCVAISVISAFHHSTVYRNYPVLTNRMIVTGVTVLVLLTACSVLARNGLLSGLLLAYSTICIGAAWGGYAVHRRAKLIRAERLLKPSDSTTAGGS